jgi:hypothetical protein
MATNEPKRARRKRSISIDGYKRVEGQSPSVALAHFLAWGRTQFPFEWWPWNLALKATTGEDRLPNIENARVEIFRNCASRTRAILREKYGCDLVSMRVLGVRATVNSEDTAAESGIKAVRRVDAARRNLIGVSDLVDPSEIKNQTVREFATKQLAPLAKTLKSADLLAKLAVPDIKGILPPVKK